MRKPLQSMKITLESKQSSVILGVLALVVIVTFAPHVFAQQNGIPLGPPYGSPGYVDPNAVYGWSAGIAIAACMSGVGIWSAIRKH